MYAYKVILIRGNTPQKDPSDVHKVDLYKLLDKQELLSFGLNDMKASGNKVCVQAKDLFLYIIDVAKNTLLLKIDDVRQSIVMKSIFYDSSKREEHQQYFSHLNEFI